MKTNSTSRSAFFNLRGLLGFAFCFVGLFLGLAALNQPVTGIVRPVETTQTLGAWTATGSLSVGRRGGFTATLLTNGKVLVVGGCIENPDDPFCNGSATVSAELYDPISGTWAPTGSMITPRQGHTATSLVDGKVLVAGGQLQACLSNSSAEVYDPTTETWTSTGSMNSPRTRHSATLISSGPLAGMVLAAGGYINQNDGGCGGTAQLASAEVYNPATGIWSAISDMTKARDYPVAAALADGSVLEVGVLNCCPYHWFNSAESYNATTHLWTPTNSRATPANGPATMLLNGELLVVGGTKGTQPTSVNVSSAERFDSSTGTWTAAASMSIDRAGHAVALLPSGQALVAGGYSGGWGVCNADLASAELYDPNADAWLPTGHMSRARQNHTATTLPNGQVLVVGGSDCEGDILSSAELYTPGATTESCLPPTAGLVSWWGGDRDTSDLQGDNNGILENGASYGPGFVSRAGFSFDGSLLPVVQVGDTSSLKMTTAATIEGWILPTGPGPTAEAIIANREGEYEISRDVDGTIKWAFANTNPGFTWINTGYVAPQDAWTHVAVTYDNGLITTYGNGVQVHQYQGSGQIGDTEPTLNDFRIGNRQAFPQPWEGTIDELKIYNRALTSSEVASIFAAGSDGNCKPRVFVQDISPYAVPKTGGAYKVGTTIQILDALRHPMSQATVRVTVTLPGGGSFSDSVPTDSGGNTDYSIFSSTYGRYVFKVDLVRKLGRHYDRHSNVESHDEITIP